MTALWWVPAGHRPSTDEAEERVRWLRRHGPTPYAFTFRAPVRRPGRRRPAASWRRGRRRTAPPRHDVGQARWQHSAAFTAATLRGVGLRERLLTGRVVTPAPWSPAAGPLVPLAEQLQQGWSLSGVATLVGVVAAVLTGLLQGAHPAGLAGAGVTFVMASGLFTLIASNTSRQQALLQAARAVPSGNRVPGAPVVARGVT